MKANSLFRMTALAAALLAGTAYAEMTLYKQPNFTGDALTVRGGKSNLKPDGFYDNVSSIVIKSGRWQVCTQPDYNGDCVTLERGQYPQLAQNLNHRIESVRELNPPVAKDERGTRDQARYAEDRRGDRRDREHWLAQNDRWSRGDAVELYGQQDFRGRSLRVNRDADTLEESGLEDRVSSLVVNEGRWQVCTRPGYEGVCRVFEPGRYPYLGRLNDRVGSLKRVG
jgi:beta/gamma crystallin